MPSSAEICSYVMTSVRWGYPRAFCEREDGQQAELLQLLVVELSDLRLRSCVVFEGPEAEEVDELAELLAVGGREVLLSGGYLLDLLPLGELGEGEDGRVRQHFFDEHLEAFALRAAVEYLELLLRFDFRH